MTYLLESAGTDENCQVLYDTKVDGIVVRRAPYRESYQKVLEVIADADRYQEANDGKIYCDLSGADVKGAAAIWNSSNCFVLSSRNTIYPQRIWVS
jgi:hypothetical protein